MTTCPLCKSHNAVLEQLPHRRSKDRYSRIRCSGCHRTSWAMGSAALPPDSAKTLADGGGTWNAAPSEPPLPAVMKAMADEIRESQDLDVREVLLPPPKETFLLCAHPGCDNPHPNATAEHPGSCKGWRCGQHEQCCQTCTAWFKCHASDRLDWVAMLEELTEPDSEETPPT